MEDREELLAVANAVRLTVSALYRRVRDEWVSGLSPSETAVLSRLDRDGPATIADLARLQGVTPQAVGATVAALTARGLLTRAPDPDDGRRALLSPTADGRELIHHSRDAVAERLADALAEHYSAEDVALIRRAAPMIQRLADLI
jgi:DNA-binding MarR family transcriptional regulator